MTDITNSTHFNKLIAFPTETVYGLGASAYDPDAIQAVFNAKGRPTDNPLIVHVSGIENVADFASIIPEDASKLMAHFWPGPLTVVLKKRSEVLDSITAGLDTVAIRMPNHPLALQLLVERGPMVAPSANKSGKPSPTSSEHVRADFGDTIEIVDGGRCDLGLESTVLDCSQEPFTILRPGHISADDISKVIGKNVVLGSNSSEKPRSPGMKYSHYSPEAAVRWMKIDEKPSEQSALYLLHRKAPIAAENVISYSGDLHKMAAELYDRFRQADLEGYEHVVIEQFDSESSSLISALTNRIEKAIGE